MRNTVFLGIKHCGKSTQGKLLAQRLQQKFFDSDELLSEAYMRKYAADSAEAAPRAIMQKHGEEFFRRFEAEVIRNFLAQKSDQRAVLALGGGVPCNDFLTTEELKALGVMVYLDIAPEEAYKRIAAGGIPPFLAGGDPWKKFQEMYNKRVPRYKVLADVTIRVTADPVPEELNETIFQHLQAEGLL